VFVWAGGVIRTRACSRGLSTGHNCRIKVDHYLRVLDHPDIYVAGDVASVVDPHSGHVPPPPAQLAGGGRDGGPQPRRGAKGPAARGVHLPRQRVRRLGRRPPRGSRYRRHHQRRSAGPPAQRRHRVEVPPIGQPLARLEPNNPRQTLGRDRFHPVRRRLRLCGPTGADPRVRSVRGFETGGIIAHSDLCISLSSPVWSC
jgi:hypothetical protein